MTSLAERTTLQGTPEAFAPPLRRASDNRASVDDSSLNELHIWQLALRSFFNLRNHSLSDAERAEIVAHDFSPELKIVNQVLRRSLLLSLNCTSGATHASFEMEETAPFEDISLHAVPRGATTQEDNSPLVPLINTLSDLCRMCESVPSVKVDFQVWSSVEQMVRRELEHSPFIEQLERRLRTATLLRQYPELHKLTERMTPDTLAADMSAIFSQIMQMLEQLRLVETLLRQDAPLKQSLAIFTLVHEETRALVDFIEKRAIHTEDIDGAVFDALDCTGYAIGVELTRVFGRELLGLASLRQSPAIYTKVENAHGLLRDSFQQSLVSLAQVFDATFNGAHFFQSFRSRLAQSLVLRRDLWRLRQLVLQAEQDRDTRPLVPLIERLDAFREGSLRFLMYKDWETYERFVAEVLAARGAVELAPVLHRFGTYLEALFGQINMRIVLADHPFDYPALVE
ncbi:MAG TPA: hypothetical protein VGB76_13960 [Pyrinomonadaceae bacterium]|jgi:hypothetical protein